MEEKAAAAEAAREEYRLENEAVDAVAAQVAAEEEAYLQTVHEKQALTQAYITEFLKEQEAYRLLEAEKERIEDERVAKHAAELESREAALNAKRSAAREAAENAAAAAAEIVIERERQRAEMEQLVMELVQDEVEEAARRAERESIEAKQRAVRELKIARIQQVHYSFTSGSLCKEDSRLWPVGGLVMNIYLFIFVTSG